MIMETEKTKWEKGNVTSLARTTWNTLFEKLLKG